MNDIPDNLEELFTEETLATAIKLRVVAEPELQAEIASMRPGARRRLARKLFRWARQAWISAAIMEADEAGKAKKELTWLSLTEATLN